VPVTQLQAEIKRRLKDLPKLKKQRDELDAQIEELQSLSQAEGARRPSAKPRRKAARKPARKPRRKRGRRVRNPQSLPDTLANVLKNKEMAVAEATQAVQAAGYKSTSKQFRTIVNQTLAKDPRFEAVSRGKYRLKK